ncbi:MAG: hemerythrin domain-containing protein [Burkholderiales bacterium]
MAAITQPAAREPNLQALPATQPQLQALDECHQQVLAKLAEMSRLFVHLEDHGVDTTARSMAQSIVQFFTESAQRHHADEERLVFPALLQSGDAELVAHVQRLQQDHGWLEEDWLVLAPQLSAIAEGYSWYDLDMLHSALPVFLALYEDHIELEESLIYPEARKRLDQRPQSGAGRTQSAGRRAQPGS